MSADPRREAVAEKLCDLFHEAWPACSWKASSEVSKDEWRAQADEVLYALAAVEANPAGLNLLRTPIDDPVDVEPHAAVEANSPTYEQIGWAWPNQAFGLGWFFMGDDGAEPPPRHGIRPAFVRVEQEQTP